LGQDRKETSDRYKAELVKKWFNDGIGLKKNGAFNTRSFTSGYMKYPKRLLISKGSEAILSENLSLF